MELTENEIINMIADYGAKHPDNLEQLQTLNDALNSACDTLGDAFGIAEHITAGEEFSRLYVDGTDNIMHWIFNLTSLLGPAISRAE